MSTATDSPTQFDIDRTRGDFSYPESHKFDAGTGLTKDTVVTLSAGQTATVRINLSERP